MLVPRIKNPQSEIKNSLNSIRNMMLWAVAGMVLIGNAMIASRLLDDGGFVSSVSACLAVLVLLVPMVATIAADVAAGQTKMHELAILAVFASCVQGDFTTSACVALFILLSIIIEKRTASGAERSLEALTRLAPGKAHRLRPDGSEEDVDGHRLGIGDVVRVRPGESILADGIIRKGASSINEANITGESIPVDKSPGSPVFAGTSNLTGVLDIEVMKVGEDTTIGKVRELILKAQATRLPFTRMIDEYARYYIPTVLTLAGVVLYFNRFHPDGVNRVVALLVATCPIALILATPAAVVAALSTAARLGVLFKDVNDIEAMARIKAFVFDKTGTLTTGVLEVARLAPAKGVESSQLLRAALLAEFGSNHPVAKAIRALGEKVHLRVNTPDELHEEPGRGVKVRAENEEIVAGNIAWMIQNGAAERDFHPEGDSDHTGMSVLYVLRNGAPMGWIGLHDKPREEAGESLVQLKEIGIEYVAVVSGDRKAVVDAVADKLAITDRRSECSPADKVDAVEQVKQNGYRVAFVGDGVNDAPALVSSHIGIAIGTVGNDLAMESATVALLTNNLNRLPFIMRLTKRMKWTIVQNFIVGGVVVAGGVTLSVMGKLTPLAAAVLQAVGALIVTLNSARLIREGEELAR